MAKLLHYTELEGNGEYIVITDDDNTDGEEWYREGYELNAIYPLESTGLLPTERVLIPE